MPPGPTEPARSRFPTVIAILAITSLLFLVGLTYAWSKLDMVVSTPKLVWETLPTGARIQQIRGTFRLEHDLNGIRSKRIGGACLIGDFASLMLPADITTKGVHTGACTPGTLEGKAACNPLGDGRKPGPMNPQKWEGYCIEVVPLRPDAPRGQGKCWYKPWEHPTNDGLLCNTSGLNRDSTGAPTPWQLGIDNQAPKEFGFSAKDFYNRYTGGEPARWRVSGRLLGTDGVTQRDVFSKAVCIKTDQKSCSGAP